MMHEIGQVCAVIAGVAGVLRLAFGALKAHLKEEFVTKQDFHRMERKIDHMLARRPVVRHLSREDRVDNG